MNNSFFRLIALLLLLGLLTIIALLGPLPELGVYLDLETGLVTEVIADSAAAQAGMLLGDRVIAIYGYPWEAINSRLWLLPLPWQPGTPTPVVLERENEVLALTLFAGPPDLALQVEKALLAVTALICWGTGFLLGTSPRATDWRLRWAAWFWVVLGFTIGAYQLMSLHSYIISIGILWFQITVLAPIAVALHVWYPRRPIADRVQRRSRRLLVATILLFQIGAAGLVFTATSTVRASMRLHTVAPFVFLAAFLLSVVLLWRAYSTIEVAHIRRQIRLIGAACVLAFSFWVTFLLVGAILPGFAAALPSGALTLGAVVIPLAYLASGVRADLMRLDQVARRVVIHTIAGVASVALVAACSMAGLVSVTPALFLLIVAGFYWPFFQITLRLVGSAAFPDRLYRPLRQTTASLATTLDGEVLARMLADGVRCTFQNPPIAVYYRHDPLIDLLYLGHAHDLEAPPTIDPSLLNDIPHTATALCSASDMQQVLGQCTLDPAMTSLIFSDRIVFWGVVRRSDDHVLALILLGPRGDRDPYRAQDVRELNSLLAGASLAFANSASYLEQVRAQDMIRRIYRHAQRIQELTAANIAREIHDELLNVTLRLNILSLGELLGNVKDPDLREILQAVLTNDQNAFQFLRDICEELEPTAMQDPLGLAASMRQRIDQIRALWRCQVFFAVEGAPIPVHNRVHRELVRIGREALVNALKHAQATFIRITLRFPVDPEGVIELIVRDDGRVQAPIAPKPNHFGLGHMQESARSIGATIGWQHPEDGGTAVVVSVAANVPLGEDILDIPPWLTLEPEDLARSQEHPAGVGSRSATLAAFEGVL